MKPARSRRRASSRPGRVAVVFGGAVVVALSPALAAAVWAARTCPLGGVCDAPVDDATVAGWTAAAAAALFAAGALVGVVLDGLGAVRWMRGERPLGLAPSLDERVRRDAMDR